MHAYGHDAHVTWLLGIANVMKDMKLSWKGTLILVTQSAKEIGEGAEAMVTTLSSKNVYQFQITFFLCTHPLPVGYVVSTEGIRMAGTDQIDVEFKGIGGHGSSPYLAKDPILMAASAIMSYQAIVSRTIDPKSAALITIGSIQAGSDNNVIPANSLIKLNLRWFNQKD